MSHDDIYLCDIEDTYPERELRLLLLGPEDDGCTLYANYAYIYPSYDKSTLYSAAPTSWIG